jgi:uncharacterized protein (DUF305 family)
MPFMKSLMALMAAVVTALVLSSCTSPASDGHAEGDHGAGSSAAAAAPSGQPTEKATENATANNAADVTFVTDMIPHHEQAVKMSALVPDRSTDPAVIKLAATISAEQGPEIDTMKGFLAAWNAGGTDRQGHDGEMSMPGMVDQASMTTLESLRGAEFDRLWLQSMVGHHEGAIAMAKTEIADGANADAKTLAEQIVTAQQAEIGQMKQMLGET